MRVLCSPGSLGRSKFRKSLIVTLHVKLVSVVLRGKRVRVEEELVEGEVGVMMVRPPDTISLPLPSSQVWE